MPHPATILPYSDLTQAQAAEVAERFRDAHFGTDASQFLYEFDADGTLSGRHNPQAALLGPRKSLPRTAPVHVSAAGTLILSDDDAMLLSGLALRRMKDQIGSEVGGLLASLSCNHSPFPDPA